MGGTVKNFGTTLLMIACMFVFVGPDLQAGEKDTVGIRLGGIAHPYGGAFLGRVEYEHSFTDLVSIVPSANYLTYDYEDDGYEEEGDGPGIGCLVKFYPGENHQDGFWIGPGVTVFFIDWEYNDYYWSDDNSFVGIAPAAELGWKIELSNRVLIDPSFALGYHTSFDTDDDDAEPEATTVFAVFSVGISFGVGGK